MILHVRTSHCRTQFQTFSGNWHQHETILSMTAHNSGNHHDCTDENLDGWRQDWGISEWWAPAQLVMFRGFLNDWAILDVFWMRCFAYICFLMCGWFWDVLWCPRLASIPVHGKRLCDIAHLSIAWRTRPTAIAKSQQKSGTSYIPAGLLENNSGHFFLFFGMFLTDEFLFDACIDIIWYLYLERIKHALKNVMCVCSSLCIFDARLQAELIKIW